MVFASHIQQAVDEITDAKRRYEGTLPLDSFYGRLAAVITSVLFRVLAPIAVIWFSTSSPLTSLLKAFATFAIAHTVWSEFYYYLMYRETGIPRRKDTDANGRRLFTDPEKQRKYDLWHAKCFYGKDEYPSPFPEEDKILECVMEAAKAEPGARKTGKKEVDIMLLKNLALMYANLRRGMIKEGEEGNVFQISSQ